MDQSASRSLWQRLREFEPFRRMQPELPVDLAPLVPLADQILPVARQEVRDGLDADLDRPARPVLVDVLEGEERRAAVLDDLQGA